MKIKSLVVLSFSLLCSFISHAQEIDTFIDLGTHKLHFHIVKGKGTPILFESGNGDDGQVWSELLKPIHEATGATLITYDRAGLGQSEIDTSSISFQNEIKNLEVALMQLGYSKNLFIACHSFGGFYSTLLANRKKVDIKGAVYIDVALPCFFTEQWAQGFTDSISTGDWEMIHQYKTGLYYVLQNLSPISAFMADKFALDDIPITLIAAEKILPMVKEHEIDKWKECLFSFGNAKNKKYVLAKNAGHKVWEDDAQIVIDEIVKLYQKVE